MGGFERILLTGGAGFVGSYLAPLLAAAYPNARRFMLVKPNEPCRDANWTPRAADLLNKNALDEIVADTRPDLVVHLAGQASIGKAQADGTTTTHVNLDGSSNLASALGRHARRTTVLFASSVAVYGASLKRGKAAENTPLDPLDAYGRSKMDAEAVLTSRLADESRLIVARPVNHSGPRQDAKSFALSSFAAQIAAIELGRWEPRIIVGDLSKKRDFLDVRDVVDAYIALTRAARTLPDRVSFFNIASGEAHSIRSLLDRLCAISGRDYPSEIDPKLVRSPGSDIDCIVCDASHLRETTGWAPRRSIDDLLRSLLEYWRNVDEATLIAALPENAPR
jgi:GDP-4-dehydro-6-deoxy-D-mannose reductase